MAENTTEGSQGETEYVYSAQKSQVDEGCTYPVHQSCRLVYNIDVLGSTYRYIHIS